MPPMNELIQTYSLSLSANQRAGVGITLGGVALIAAFAMLTHQRDAIPFTPQEWWWAIQGGYLDTMVSHFIRNGGI